MGTDGKCGGNGQNAPREGGKPVAAPGSAPPSGQAAAASSPSGASPPWANNLKQLYNSIVEEPLPDCFQELLDQLDEEEDESKPPHTPKDGLPKGSGQQ